MLERRLSRSVAWFQSLAIAAAMANASALYLANLLAWPWNASVREWWGSELAIRYCQGFVRRGILGQISWQFSGWLGHQSFYSLLLTLVMAGMVLLLGLWLMRQLVKHCGWRLGLLILAAPAGWPVLMVHAGSTFRKDSLQILLGALLLWIWSHRVRGRWPQQAALAWLGMAGIEVFAVLNHEPFALLILPTLAIAVFWQTKNYILSILSLTPGLMALLLAILHKGTPGQVLCLRADLQRLGLLSPAEMPGSAITELSRSTPSYPTWDLDLIQLGWSAFHLVAMSAVVIISYYLLFRCIRPRQPALPFLVKAATLWGFQLFLAMPLFVTTVDYGRMMAMMFCAGLALILLCCGADPLSRAWPAVRGDLWRAGLALALLELFLLPSHCCTYNPGQIIAFMPYVAASQWKALLLHSLLPGFLGLQP